MAGYRKLGRTSSQRKALIRGQVTSLLNNGKIEKHGSKEEVLNSILQNEKKGCCKLGGAKNASYSRR